MCKKCCRNCHFLTKYHQDETGKTHTLFWNDKDIKTSKLDFPYVAECYHMVWSEGIYPNLNIKLAELVGDQRDNCFFFPVYKGMSFQAASVLQERNAQNSQLKRTNWYAIIGLWIAGLSLAGSLIINIINICKP